jgi:hypothetical protein
MMNITHVFSPFDGMTVPIELGVDIDVEQQQSN